MIVGSRVGAIELAGDEIRVAVVKTGRGTPRVLEAQRCVAEYEDPAKRREALVHALDQCLSQLTSRPAVYVLCCSSLYSIVRTLSIPFRGARKVAAAVPLELEPFLAFPLEDLLVDYITISEHDGETQVLALGIRRAVLEDQLDILREAGIEAEAVNLDAIAMTGLWQSLHKSAKSLNGILHVREHGAIFAITYHRRVAFVRHISVTPQQIAEAPVALAREISNTLRSFLAKWHGEEKQFEMMHITGIQLSPAERSDLEEALGMPVEDMVMLEKLGAPTAASADSGYNVWEAAVGTAQAAAGGLFSLDFTRTERDWNSVLRGVVTHLMFSSCLALLVLLGWMFYYFQGTAKYGTEADKLQGELDQVNTQIEEVAAQTFAEEIETDVFADPTLLDLLQEISTKMPDNKVTIDEIRVAPPGAKGSWILIEGKAADPKIFNDVFADLKSSPLFYIDEEADKEMRVEGAITFFKVQANRPNAEEEATEGEPEVTADDATES